MFHGGRSVARAIAAEGVTHVFTLPGDHVQHVYDGCDEEGVRVVDLRHEASPGHAAEAWSRITGRPGVAIVGGTAGIVGIVGALAHARAAAVPLVCIAGAAGEGRELGRATTAADELAIAGPVTKAAAVVEEPHELTRRVAAAFRLAKANVPGPVLLQIAEPVLAAEGEDPGHEGTRPPDTLAPDPKQAEQVAAKLRAAQRPIALIGSPLRNSLELDALEPFLDAYDLPVFLHGMACGALPLDHPSLFSRTAEVAWQKADLALVIGAPPVSILKLDSPPPIVRIGPDAVLEEGAVGMVCDAGLGLLAVADVIKARRRDEWHAELREAEDAAQAAIREAMKSDVSPPTPYRVCAELARYVDDETIVVVDGGTFAFALGQTLPVRWPGALLGPDPIEAFGVAPPFALAAKLARPDAKVLCIQGDGAFGLRALEWEAMARHGIRVVGIVGADGVWNSRSKLSPMRYDQVATACGATGFYAETATQLGQALEQAFGTDGPAVVDVRITPS